MTMARWGLLLQCVAESVASQGLRGLMGMVPFGQVLYEVGQGVVERYSKKVQRAEEVACLQDMVVQSHAAIRAEVESRYESIVQNVPESVRAEIQKPEVRARVVAYAAEAGQFQTAGFSTVICGPGSIDQAHQPDEYVSLAQLARCESFLRGLADPAVRALLG
jgi:acetylornithine deacetylase/succinyl-diaminopimelate desuccinylase-like protein